jgi:prepilin-type N-terminal cleavage/methylation domain-containing protein
LPSRRGFSLIEVLIVLVMIGLLVGITAPRVGRQITRDRVLRSAVVVQGMLDEATQLSTRLRSPVQVSYASGTLTVRDREAGTVLRSRRFGADQDLRATVASSPASITIFPGGRSDAGIRITLSGGDFSTVVSRTTTGIVRRQ